MLVAGSQFDVEFAGLRVAHATSSMRSLVTGRKWPTVDVEPSRLVDATTTYTEFQFQLNRISMTKETTSRGSPPWVAWAAGVVLSSIVFCSSVAGALRSPQKAVICDVGATQGVVPSRTAVGVLTRLGDIYFVHHGGLEDVFVAGCFVQKGGGGCHGPVDMLRGHSGEPVNAAFCGRTLTHVELSGRQVFDSAPPSQAALDALAQPESRMSKALAGFSLAVALLCAFGCRRSKAGKRVA